MAETDAATAERDDSALEESARERLGVQRWDRPLIFRETAEAATDVRLPYWSMLVLSAAIATLGLALNNAAVVIGAMLIAPLLAPTMGLALSIAMGDVRLASQTGIAVVVSIALVIITAALLTLALPFQTFTPEITTRTRPTTLDLGIAVFSGLAGAVVSVTRRKGLSAALPGVAVAVALIPPLAVAGFSAGAGMRWPFIWGSLLLFGANLAGIVFSGTIVFLLIGMHRPSVLSVADEWHARVKPTRLGAWAARTRWFPSIGPIRTPVARIGLIVAVVVALAIPLTITLTEIARETRVQRAVRNASQIFDVDGRSFILSIEPVFSDGQSQVILRIATTEWFGDQARDTFERTASARAGEPVRLVLEQVPISSGDLDQIARLFPQRAQRAEADPRTDLFSILSPARDWIRSAVAGLSVPDGMQIVGFQLLLGEAARQITVGYTANAQIGRDVDQILSRQLRLALSAPELEVGWQRVPTDTLALTGMPADSAQLGELANFMKSYQGLRAAVLSDTSRSALVDSTIERLERLGVDSGRVAVRYDAAETLRIAPYAAPY